MPVQKVELLETIDQLERSIRDGYKGSIEPKRFEGPVGSRLMARAAVAHALWFLEHARTLANEHEGDFTGVGWCIGVAAGVVLPLGIATPYDFPLAGGIFPALVAPSPNKPLVSA